MDARRVLLLHAAVAALAFACTSGHVKPSPPPNIDAVTTTTSTTLDFTTVDLVHVKGQQVESVPIGPGTAGLGGTVNSPAGPVAGATVGIDRVVDGFVGHTQVFTQADGTWTLPNILGGVYRVRAWRAPDLALTTPVEVFLLAGDNHSLTLSVGSYGGLQVSPALAPDPAIIGEPAALGVRVTTSAVGDDGVVRASPHAGSVVQLFGSGAWSVDGSQTKTTPSSGVVTWQLTCDQLGPQPLSVVVDSANVFPLNLQPCAPVPTTTTSTTTTVVGQTTTTVKRPRRTTTTTG